MNEKTTMELTTLIEIFGAKIRITIVVPETSEITSWEAARLFQNLKDEISMAASEFLASREEKNDVAFSD